MEDNVVRQRRYKLSIQDSFTGEILVIENPITLEFDVIRNNFSSLNSANLSLFNLSETSRKFLRKDINDSTTRRNIRLEIGYGQNLSLAYQGSITKSYSTRSGVNFITHIESLDGYFQSLNSIYKNTFNKGTKKGEIVADIIKKLKLEGLFLGAIPEDGEEIKRGMTFNGNTFNILKKLTRGKFFIDNGKVNVLSDSQAILADVIVIDGDVLINTPTIENYNTKFEILLDTTIVTGQRLKLSSKKFDNKNISIYRVSGITHKGTISEVVSAKCTTLLTCSFGHFKQVAKDGTILDE